MSPRSCGKCCGLPGVIAREKWPAFREDLTREEQIEVIIQINGRLRGKILVDESLSRRGDTRARAERSAHLGSDLDGKAIVKMMVVPKKLVNIVLR